MAGVMNFVRMSVSVRAFLSIRLRSCAGRPRQFTRPGAEICGCRCSRGATFFEDTQHLIARLKSGGEQEAANLRRKVGGMARSPAISPTASTPVAWPEITRIAAEGAARGDDQSGGLTSLI